MFWQATEQIGAFSEAFQTQTSPQTHAKAVFQAQTATGKLNAEITPTTPRECHCSLITCCGLSDGIVCPFKERDKPTAKSQMSIIS